MITRRALWGAFAAALPLHALAQAGRGSEPARTGAPPESRAAAGWWTQLDDPVLADLVSRGLAANHDIAQAAARVREARAIARGADAERWPGGSLGLSHANRQLAQAEAPGRSAGERHATTLRAGADLSWEIDLFDRLGARARAASARGSAAALDLQAMRLAVAADIAQAWFALQGAREQLALLQGIAANRVQAVELVERRSQAGAASGLDRARARADLAAIRADVPQARAAVEQASYRLAVLLGEAPDRYEPPEAAQRAPSLVAIPVHDVASQLLRRPDLLAQEAGVRALGLDVEALRADMLPRLQVGALLGFIAGHASGLGAAGTLAWQLVEGFSWPVFDHGRLQARVDAAQARHEGVAAAYRQRLLLAAEEAHGALARYREGGLRLAHLQERTAQAAEAERLARARYRAGSADLLEWLDAQRQAADAGIALTQALTAHRVALADAMRALAIGEDADAR